MPQLKEIMKKLEELAPLYLAEKWDHVGLMIGDPHQEVKRILCVLDINEAIVEEAITQKVDCIVSHHPFLFKPLTFLDLSTGKGKMIKQLMAHEIAVYSMHTNYDIAWGGLNDYLAEGLGLKNKQILSRTYEETFCKVIIYVPQTHIEQVREKIVSLDLGSIGNYKGCSFTVSGEGTFIPLEGSHPFIGEEKSLTKVKEKAVSFIVPEIKVEEIIEAIRQVHPYEEMAYDVFKVENIKKVHGLGRYGKLEQPMILQDLLVCIKNYFNIPYVRISTEDLNREVKKVAICSGEGSGLIEAASKVADVYITGDVKFHQAQQAQDLGLIIVDVGHYASENKALQPIADCLTAAFEACEIIFSQVNGETLFIR